MPFTKRTLYGLDKGGSFKQWSIWTKGDKLFIEHGKENGKLQIKEETIVGKNIGRSNETTPADQAISEAVSRVQKQLDKGYRFDKKDLEVLPLLPMLAQPYDKKGHVIKWPCIGSPKMDGVRCLAICEKNGVKLISRGGKEYNLKYIQEFLYTLMEEGEIFDGELYIHGMALEEIVSAVKKPNENTPKLSFIAFDYVSENWDYATRLADLELTFKNFVLNEFQPFKIVESVILHNEAQMKSYHKDQVAKGYEGVMLRNKSGMYESGKRSNDLQKYKEFLDSEFKILEITLDKNGGAVFTVQNTFADNTFNVQWGTHEQRAEQYKNRKKYIGKLITVQYQTLYKDTLIPQFPTGKGIRDYE